MPSIRGQSAIVIPVPDAEPFVSGWRERYDHSAVEEMPAHLTVLYPFLEEPRLTPSVLGRLSALFADVAPIDVVFPRTGRFDGVLYLAPEPADVFRQLTAAVTERWPEAPPYGGVHDAVVPHLTVAFGEVGRLGAIERDLWARLPLRTRVDRAGLYVFDGVRWEARVSLPFGR
jgi:2'-5' RNA ligase